MIPYKHALECSNPGETWFDWIPGQARNDESLNQQNNIDGLPARASLFSVAVCLVLSGTSTAGESAATEKEFEAVRSQIRTVQTRIKSAEDEIEQMLAELREYEIAASNATKALTKIDHSITDKQDRLAVLNGEFNQLGKNLQKEKKRLSEQVRVMYKTGRNDYIKLLLNQEDPAIVGRTLAYHDYYNRARTKRIGDIKLALEQLKTLQDKINGETEELISLRSNQESKLVELDSYRQDREKLLVRSRRFVNDQDRQLQALQKTERELAALLANLESRDTVMERYEDEPPFASLKGKLTWPVRGKIRIRYGDFKKGGKLKSRGITFASEAGTEVHAISSGKVIYADWFRNLGLLLILDHGDGFMSLYGYNEVLLKKPGDQVGKNKPIAKTGDTGGQEYPGLYFEIRRSGNPLNPSLWCRS